MNLFVNNHREDFDFTDGMVFNKIYGQYTEESKQALIALLNTVTGDKPDESGTLIKDINIFNPIDYSKTENCCQIGFDIRLETDTGSLFSVEMENHPDKYFKNRILLNMTYILKSRDEMKNTTVVAFAGGNLFEDIESYHSVFGFRDKKNNRELTDSVSFHFIEIDKVDRSRDVSDMTPLERVALYFRYANDPNNEALLELLIDSGDKAIVLAENIFSKLAADDMAYELMLARKKFRYQYNTDLSEARKEGIEQGRAAEKVEMAKALKAKGVDADIIAEVSGLPARDIESM